MIEIPLIDLIAVVWFLLCWIGYSVAADKMSKHKGSLLVIINEYRLNWMRQMLKRDNRMVDSTLIGNLLRSIAFFASTTIFIVLGLFTMLKYRKEASDIITSVPFSSQITPVLWELKIFLLVIIFIYTFFKYTWSLRQYNYACVIVGAAPLLNTETPENLETYAVHSAKLIGNAARHFNMGLRAYYFGLAAIAWFLNGWAFMATSALVVWVLYRREFRSQALQYMTDAAIFRKK
jgi:uncharacterized membrane protein